MKEINKLVQITQHLNNQIKDQSDDINFERQKIIGCDKDIRKLTTEKTALRNLMDSIEDQIQELNVERESIQTILASEEEALSRHQKELHEKRDSEKGEHRTRSIMETKIKKHT